MVMEMDLYKKKINVGVVANILRNWTKIRLQPIRVYCFHQVSAQYNPLTMWECDWTQIDQFKRNVLHLKAHYKFISLTEAHEKLKHDIFRIQKYAVLTADDGYKSLLNIIPWLEEQHIPITIFLNTKYLDGKSWSAINEKQARQTKPDVDVLAEVCPYLYLNKTELKQLTYSPYVTIGMHGHEHLDAMKQTEREFEENVHRCQEVLTEYTKAVPYFAYTWGRYNHTRTEDF